MYMENLDAGVRLFFASGTNSKPVDFGGKGTSWQEVAPQGGSELGIHV